MVRTAWRCAGAALVVAAALGGCTKEETAGPPTSDGKEGEGIAVLRKFPLATSGGLHDARREVVRDGKTWLDLWTQANRNVSPIPRPPAVDFGKEMVALASLGEKPTAGWSIEIVGARRAGGKVRVLFVERSPAAGAPAAAVVTHPWHAVVLPRSDDPVEWVPYVPPVANAGPPKKE